MTPIFTGLVAGRKLQLDSRDQFDTYLLSLEGKQVEVTVEKMKRKRTVDQNSYYWLILTTIGKELGYTSHDVHELMKSMFLKRPLWVRGKFVSTTRSTTSLDTIEMTEYIERIRQWAAEELNINIPDPVTVQMNN